MWRARRSPIAKPAPEAAPAAQPVKPTRYVYADRSGALQFAVQLPSVLRGFERREVELHRNQIRRTLEQTDKVLRYFRDGSGDIGQTGLVPFVPDFPTVVRDVLDGGASVGVLEPGDLVLAINGREMKNQLAVIEQIEQHPGKPIEVELERDGSRMLVELTPAEQDGKGLAGGEVEVKNSKTGEREMMPLETCVENVAARVIGQRYLV